ncbi:MAG: hypothetical protein DGJ47_000220 [Rickettsiaceae bacterium]
MTKSKEKKPLLIIDGYGFIFRAYHVQPPLTSPSGQPVGAIYGFTSMLLKILGDFKPEYAVVVLDHAGKNFRHDLYDQYKANRPPAPDDLKSQLQLVQKSAEALNFKCISKQGFEADDLIATLAKDCSRKGQDAIVISADKDLMQLVDDNVRMYDPAKYKFIEESDIIKKFGVGANKVRHVQALMGDSSDNIPGIAGVGPKTASKLINEYGDLDNIFNSIEKLTPRHQKLFTEYKKDALLSWELVGLDEKVEIDTNIEQFTWQAPMVNDISQFINDNGFKSLNKRVENIFNLKISPPKEEKKIITNTQTNIVEVTSLPQLDKFSKEVRRVGKFALSYQPKSDSIELFAGSDVYNINFKPSKNEDSGDLFSYASSEEQSTKISVLICDLLTDPTIKKIIWDIKLFQKQFNVKLAASDDLMIMEYVLNSGKKLRAVKDILGTEVSSSCEVSGYLECYDKLRCSLIEEKILHLYQSLDLPLSYTLKNMEYQGVRIDICYLQKLSKELSSRLHSLEKLIYNEAKEEFNIASPKQLGAILFDKMDLPFGKKSGKTQSYSTNVDILEKLKSEGYTIADLLLDYRHLSKLQNTYIEALPKQANKNTHRIHTTFLQCSTSTSRLSSINPNVQNIPVRTEEGNKIRAAFVAKDNHKLISADYSQIELRILSHVANIESLKNAFLSGKDIHAQTASQIFKIDLSEVTSEIRRKAKAINFGIIYGISAFGLAKQLGVSNKEASEYIALYFEEYPGIEKYMKETIEFAKENGFIPNLMNRKCHLPMINDKNHALRSFAQRAAINAPMQSLASDIVKIAMIKIDTMLKEQQYKTKMILQIHDELIFEAPEEEVQLIMPKIKNIMEEPIGGKCSGLALKVDINSGANWQEIH